jgi:glycosyltransferase involved in cell wall biosynthesis
MKILICSHFFSPSIGGIQTSTLLLAREFVSAGHEVKVVTTTRDDDGTDHGYEVIRSPAPGRLLGVVNWCDVYFQNNISLRTAWPLLFVWRPWVVATHMWLPDGVVPWITAFKRMVLMFATRLYVSEALRRHVGLPGAVIPNVFDAGVFRLLPEIPRDRDFVFLGRLVSDKGADVLLGALSLMIKQKNWNGVATIIGIGPEEAELRRMVDELGLQANVIFAGPMQGEELVRELNRYKIVVIPSLMREPFGIVALEGIACGCTPVASADGGLPEAVGSCGLFFQNGNVAALAERLMLGLESPDLRRKMMLYREAHLAQFRPEGVATIVLQHFELALGRRQKRV